MEITKEMIDKIHTDSDIRDLAEELEVSYGELDFAIRNKLAEGSPCYNCKNVVLGWAMYPCNNCTRIGKDQYESI